MNLLDLKQVDALVTDLLSTKMTAREYQNNFSQLKLKTFDDYSEFESLNELLRKKLKQLGSKESFARYYLFDTIATNLIHHQTSWNMRHGGCIPTINLIQELRNLCFLEKELTNNPLTDIFLAISYHLVQDDKRTYDYFCQAANYPKLHQFIFDDKIGCLTAKPWSVSKIFHSERESIAIPELQWKLFSKTQRGKFVVSFFCDDVYFQAFSPFLISSLQEVYQGGEFCIHFHVTNPSQDSEHLLKVLPEKISDIPVDLFISYEETNVKDRAYFTVNRFLMAERILQFFNKDLIILDADCDFLVSPVKIWEHFKDYEVAGLVCKGPWGYVPWRAYWAGFNYFANKRCGVEFASLLNKVIQYLWNPDRGNWWIDQNALYMTQRLMHIFYPGMHFLDMDGGLATSFIESTEELKISRLSSLEKVKNDIKNGQHWAAVLGDLQLSK